MDLSTNEAGSYTEACLACGRSFRGPGGLQNHSRGCQPGKKRLRKTLAAAKDVLARKRQRRDRNTTGGIATEISEDMINVRRSLHTHKFN